MICENLDRRIGTGTYDVMMSNRYTTDMARSLFTMPCAGEIDCDSSARSAAKYAVGEKSAFWSRSVSSTAESTTAVYTRIDQ